MHVQVTQEIDFAPFNYTHPSLPQHSYQLLGKVGERMADAVCGPSNPLQQFKQQSQLDRTLQQDRLTSRHSPAQGFRSANPNVGLLDPEFEAFQAGLPAPDLPQYHHQQQQFPSPSFASSSQAPAWATDFQRMHISSPPPFAQHQVSQAGPATANWTQGFREHIAQNAPRAQNSSPSPLAFQQSARYGYNGYQSNFQHRSYASPLVQSKGKELATDQFDDAAFERAFDQARDEMMMEEGAMSEGIETDVPLLQKKTNASESDVLNNTMHDIDDASVQEALPLVNITDDETEALREALDRQEETQAAEPMQQEEDDALAATAQELLEKVEHNPTDKFRNSQFLNLIRKLRDREVKVEGDKMVEQTVSHTYPHVAQPSSHLTSVPLSHNNSSSGSGAATPMSWDSAHFDTHICGATNCAGDGHSHTLDHWESPYT